MATPDSMLQKELGKIGRTLLCDPGIFAVASKFAVAASFIDAAAVLFHLRDFSCMDCVWLNGCYKPFNQAKSFAFCRDGSIMDRQDRGWERDHSPESEDHFPLWKKTWHLEDTFGH